MAIDLIKEVMDHAPDDLTPGERYALVVLAEDAWLPEREVKHDITDEYLLHRLHMGARSWANMRSELVKKKAIEKVEGGHNGKKARYRIPIFNEAMKGHRFGEATAEVDPELGTGFGEPTGAKVHRIGESRFTESVNLTYITPPTPSTTPREQAKEGEDARGDKASEASALVASLPSNFQPGRGGRADLVAALTELLSLGWPAEALRSTLTGHALPAQVHNLARLMITWLPEPAPYRATANTARASPALPSLDHCGACNPDRLIEDEDGNRVPCRTCHPKRKAHP